MKKIYVAPQFDSIDTYVEEVILASTGGFGDEEEMTEGEW